MKDKLYKKRKDSSYSAKDIEILEGLEPVRVRPGMYIGTTDEDGMHHLATEIIDNAMDEVVAGFATKIEIYLKDTGSPALIKDPGDFDSIYVVMPMKG